MLKCVVDRIEDGKFAVLHFYEGKKLSGELIVNVSSLGLKVREGMHLEVMFEPDPGSEEEVRTSIESLRQSLLSRGKKKRK